MKLYFYFLEGMKNGCFRIEECEVEEKPKTYWIVNRPPPGFHRTFVSKNEIGRFASTLDQNIIILTEKDPERVAELFSIKCKADISRAKDRIRDAEIEIEKSNDILDAIEEWQGVGNM